jgi:hypothetical protein
MTQPNIDTGIDARGDTATGGANPLAGNPLTTRAEVQQAARDCYTPLLAHLSPGGARARLGPAGATSDPAAADLEGFARPLWGLAALSAGGGQFDHWDRIRQGVDAGTDPDHPEYWGPVVDHDQRIVEAAAVGAALLLAPDQLWDPLEEATRRRLVAWLSAVDRCAIRQTNWLFFRVLVDLGLARVGAGFDARAHDEALDGIDALYRGDGWYRDGVQGTYDWYGAFAFHTYGLLYAASGLGQPRRVEQFTRRAARFAVDLQHWFGPDGAALAFGRSMTYRFAQSAFWGALALADVEALPWGQVKGLYLRNLRHWSGRPITDRDGVLSIGYGYGNPRLAEDYSSPGSPYWAMKAFLALAVGPDHPFWQAEEMAQAPAPRPVVQAAPGFVLSRDDEQVLAVGSGQPVAAWLTGGAAKYQRLAYSSRFGFSLDVVRSGSGGAGDSTLWLVDGEGDQRERGTPEDVEVVGELIASRWRPWPDVVVDTVVWGQAPWHGRAHRIRTGRRLTTREFGFALGLDPDPAGGDTHLDHVTEDSALVTSPRGRSGLRVHQGRRQPQVRSGSPNSNLEWPATRVPVLTSTLGTGTHDLICLVLGSGPLGLDAWDHPPAVPDAAIELLDRRAPHRSATIMVAAGAGARAASRVPRPRELARRVRDRLRWFSPRRGS